MLARPVGLPCARRASSISTALLNANPDGARIVLTVGNLFALHDGDNPHRWYDPAEVEVVANTIAADLEKLEPSHDAYFEHQLHQFTTVGLADYHALIAQIKARYAGVPVGASESIFALQAPALGLDLVTPASFMKAVSEGTEISAQDTITGQRQITSHEIKVWIYNSQNATPRSSNSMRWPAGTMSRSPPWPRRCRRRPTRSSSGRWRSYRALNAP